MRFRGLKNIRADPRGHQTSFPYLGERRFRGLKNIRADPRGHQTFRPHTPFPYLGEKRYVGNIHTQVTEPLPQEVCKHWCYGILFGQPIKVNYAYASGQMEDTSSHYNIFVGDLSPEVAMMYACVPVYTSCSDARVMWDQKTGRSKGFDFVSFRNQHDAQSAINDSTGKWLGSRQKRCNWATKGVGTSDDNQNSDTKSVVELTNGSSEDVIEAVSSDAPENNPQYTTMYVGNLVPENKFLTLKLITLIKSREAYKGTSFEELGILCT
ncbi:hypothetical protein ACS0TY_021848 [Phlomoides rotata]